jgi:hypothetical protein
MKSLTMTLMIAAILTIPVATLVCSEAGAQPPAGGQQPGGGPPRQGAPRGPGIEPLAINDATGFEPIFDGKTLNGWDGNPEAWRVDNGTIVGESTAEKPLKANTFLIWRGGQPKDFELKLE